METIVVIDFGSQYGQLIARRVRELGVYSRLVPYEDAPEAVRAPGTRGVILSGGPRSVFETDAPSLPGAVLEQGLPVLGICYGAQLLAHRFGGRVRRGARGEYGSTRLRTTPASGDSRVLPDAIWSHSVWMSHFDAVEKAPGEFTVTALTEHGQLAAFESPARDLYAVQFHPEVVHTGAGGELLRRFCSEVCACSGRWRAASIIDRSLDLIRDLVGRGKLLCAVSGGIDSAVTTRLSREAIGERAVAVHVDSGLMRRGESEAVAADFASGLGGDLVMVDAADRFLSALARVTQPERKRKIIGERYIREFEDVARRHGIRHLAQGTIYPDVIESGFGASATIKSHHNVGGLPKQMDLDLVEPLRDLFKDEVRAIARELCLPQAMIDRQPFPGPGLAIRIVGAVTRGKLDALRSADDVLQEEISRAGLDRDLWQCFAVLLSLKTVGVMGDRRTYAYPIVVRAVTSVDAMTADWARIPHDVLDRIANRIVAEVDEVNRVVLDLTSKPPGTIGWE